MPLTKIDDRGLTTPIDLQDNEKIRLGTGNDLELYFNGNQGVVNSKGNNLLLFSDTAIQISSTAGSKYFKGQSGAAELYYSDSKKFETTSVGAAVTGNLGINIASPDSPLEVGGTGPSLATIHHTDGGTNDEARLMLGALSANPPDQRGAGISARNKGAGHDLEIQTSSTHSAGPSTKMTVTAGGNVQIANDSGRLQLGASQDLQIYHDGTRNVVEGAGQLRLCGTTNVLLRASTFGDVGLNYIVDGGVELFYDNVKKLETTSTGAGVTGDLALSGELNMTTGGNVNRFIDCSLDDTEALFIRSTNGGDANHQNMAIFHRQGSVELYYAAAKKFETHTNGVRVQDLASAGAYVFLKTNAGNQGSLYGTANTLGLLDGQNHYMLKGIKDAGVELYNDNVKKFATGSNGVYHDNSGTLSNNQIHFERGSGTGDYSTIFGVTNNPDSPGYGDQDDGYWAHIISKGGTIVVLNSDGAYNSGRNTHDHFSIYQKAGQSGTTGRRLFSVDNIGAVQFGLAGIKIDREWGGQPSISVQRNCNDGTDNTDDSAYFRFHGTSQTHESWTGAGSPGADFSVNLLIDGSTYATNSDRRRKTDIVDCPYGLDVVNKLQPRKFHIVNSQLEKQNNGLTLGFIAQEIKEHIPESVDYLGDEANTPNEKGWASAYAFGISEVIPVLTKSIQELSAQVKTLQAEVEALKAK